MKLWMKILMLVAAFGILYVSFARAGLDEVTNDEKYDRLRKISISYQMRDNQKACYRLPESKTLPNNPLYLFKKIRDDMWVNFSKSPLDKARIVILVADKKIYESILVYENKGENNSFWVKNMDDAMVKINLAREILIQSPQKGPELDQLERKVNEAEDFHQYILGQMKLNNKIIRCNE